MRQIDGKYSAVIMPAMHGNTCAYTLVSGARCNCGAKPRAAIVNTATGVEIPPDEPLMLFRGKDFLTRRLVTNYLEMCHQVRCRPEHTQGLEAEIVKLNAFAQAHPERMKIPD